jgi:cytochrome c biogenesis protein CcmG/thiol:disulfide interchange protein DsbE
VSAVSGDAMRGTERGSHRARRTAIVVAVVMALIVIVLAVAKQTTSGQLNAASTANPLLGKVAPPIDEPVLDPSAVSTTRPLTRISLASLRGRYVLVNFFASWCDPCRAEASQLAAFQFAEHERGHAEVIGVLFDDSAADGRAFISTYGINYPVVADPGGVLALSYGVENPPTSILVAPDGRVLRYYLGGVTEAGLEQAITQLSARRGARPAAGAGR